MNDIDSSHSSLLRSVRVLFGLVESGQATTVTRLAQALDLPVSTTHRILNVLRQAGYVVQHEDTGSYGPGMDFLRICTMLAASRHIHWFHHHAAFPVKRLSSTTTINPPTQAANSPTLLRKVSIAGAAVSSTRWRTAG